MRNFDLLVTLMKTEPTHRKYDHEQHDVKWCECEKGSGFWAGELNSINWQKKLPSQMMIWPSSFDDLQLSNVDEMTMAVTPVVMRVSKITAHFDQKEPTLLWPLSLYSGGESGQLSLYIWIIHSKVQLKRIFQSTHHVSDIIAEWGRMTKQRSEEWEHENAPHTVDIECLSDKTGRLCWCLLRCDKWLFQISFSKW